MILAVIPARAGSQRLPRKNRLEIEPGKNLVQNAIDCAADSGIVDRICVITDDPILPICRAQRIEEPATLAGHTSDIASATAHALSVMEATEACRFEYVVTLQPAVLARSPLIVRRTVEAVIAEKAGGAVTAARTVPWQWSVLEGFAKNEWYPGPYPRSQHAPHHLAEINAVQVAERDAVVMRHRWNMPLLLLELPPWAAALDIDHPADLTMARDMWPWAKHRLETWEPTVHRANSINGHAPVKVTA